MHAAQGPRPRSAATSARGVAPPDRPAPGATPPQRAAGKRVRDDPLTGLLAAAVQRRATGATPVLQRAVIAMNGTGDSATAQTITGHCLANLTKKRKRGATAGPAAPDQIMAPALGRDESLYILGHGNTGSIAGLSPVMLANQILTWYGTTEFRGKIKLVACSSAVAPKSTGPTYAERLSAAMKTKATRKFRPAAVDGVLGVAWVDEVTGKIIAIDDAAYDKDEAAAEQAFAEPDIDRRKQGLEALFGRPGAFSSSVRTGKDQWWGNAKVRYFTGLPDPGAATTASTSFWNRLVSTIS